LSPFEDAVEVLGCASVRIQHVRPVAIRPPDFANRGKAQISGNSGACPL
jgi:hypothetical protein